MYIFIKNYVAPSLNMCDSESGYRLFSKNLISHKIPTLESISTEMIRKEELRVLY